MEVSASKRRRVVKDSDDYVPLPDPYPLPKHFQADVEMSLNEGKMTRDTNRKFISAIASSILAYKKYPSSEDYINVGRTVLKKYPFLRSPQGTPQVG